MTTEPEQILEDNLIEQLCTLGYTKVSITNEAKLLANLKTQLEKHNNTQLTEHEFKQVLNYLNGGTVFERAKKLRDRAEVKREDGSTTYIRFLNQESWCKNEFQVTHQISMSGKYDNRYDVTLLINGLPLVQIELKKKGIELKEAFNQIIRYKKHSFGASYGLFRYVQLFVISNGVNTKYYANNNKLRDGDFKQTFYWADAQNKKVNRLTEFATAFLEKCHVSKMICKYTVLNETLKILMVLRPYQYYATEAIVNAVDKSMGNGYIWHTTGSGKTLTSFKASQTLVGNPKVDKVIFVVDRRDLDYQTTKEFNSFSEGSVDATANTNNLVNQLSDNYKDAKGNPKTTKLLVTTIQKLNTAINRAKYLKRMASIQDKNIVFIFDECHRSQFGDTHQRISDFFTNHQMFGFTGTPIFAQNSVKNKHGRRTTQDLFGKCLHKYVITDAIRDENVLRFSVEYVGKYSYKDDSNNNIDIEVEDIDKKELMEAESRLDKITDYIIYNYPRKTHNKEYSAMFCVSSVDMLIKYYELFRKKKEAGLHNLKVATIFSYTANEEDRDLGLSGELADEANMSDDGYQENPHTRDKLDEFITDYNEMFTTSYSTKDSKLFYNYYNNIAKRVKNKEIDLLLVVNMFLTGFDSRLLNTLFVDKNLRYHGLIQAYSRTNRISGYKKSQGNIVVFRNLKKATDDAIALFSNKEAKAEIFMKPYEEYLKEFNDRLAQLKEIVSTPDDVDDLLTEDDELEFVKAFRSMIRLQNVLSGFADFDFGDTAIEEDEFIEFRTKYLDISDKVKTNRQKEKVSVLDEVDFELELIHRDVINVRYIINLLAQFKETKNKKKREEKEKQIKDLLNSEVQLRSKKELIEKFIAENLPKIDDADSIEDAFEAFWSQQQQLAFEQFAIDEKLDQTKLEEVVREYIYSGREPLPSALLDMLQTQPSVIHRKKIRDRLKDKIKAFVQTFFEGMGE